MAARGQTREEQLLATLPGIIARLREQVIAEDALFAAVIALRELPGEG